MNGPLDVGIHVPTVFYSLHNGGEVVVRQHHTGGILGHLRSRDAHSHADVRLLQGGSVIDAVAGHGYQIAPLLPRPDDADLMLRGHTGVDADLRHKLLQFLVAHAVDDRALHGLRAVPQNADLTGNGRRRDFVVAGDHNRTDTGADALRHRCLGFLTGRVHHGDEAEESQAVFIRQSDGRAVHAAAGEGQHPQALVGKLFVDLFDPRPFLRRHHAAVQQHIRRALGDQHQATRQLVDRGHHFPVGIEGDLCQTGPAVPDEILVKAVGLPQPHQCRFRGVADLRIPADDRIAAQQSRPQQRLL